MVMISSQAFRLLTVFSFFVPLTFVLTPQPASAAADDRRLYLPLVSQAAAEVLLDPALISAVITRESGWQRYARSPKGALGLMQLMPETAKNWGVRNAYDPWENIL